MICCSSKKEAKVTISNSFQIDHIRYTMYVCMYEYAWLAIRSPEGLLMIGYRRTACLREGDEICSARRECRHTLSQPCATKFRLLIYL
jgi:hypothetical protein